MIEGGKEFGLVGILRAEGGLPANKSNIVMNKEEERAMAITHWDALISQWQLEKGHISPQRRMNVAFELREGQGSLFENRDKKNERHPDFKGDVKIGGKTYRLAAWTKQTKAGKLFYSLSVDRQDLPASDSSDVDRAIPKEDDDVRF